MKIGNKTLGDRAYIIAEAGVNHNGSLDRAKRLIKAAADAGADAIKFQDYTADDLVVKGTPKFWDAESKVDEGLDQYQAYELTGGFPRENYIELIKCCEENNIEFLCTPFSIESAAYLDSIGMKAFKVASSDMSYYPLLEHLSKLGKPILLSTGASTMAEVQEAVDVIEGAGDAPIVLLHCTLCYPTKTEDANLNLIKTLKDEFINIPVGISDHTLDAYTPALAVAMGAVVVEKHFTLDKTLDISADHWLSLDSDQFREMVALIRHAEVAKGSKQKQIFPCEEITRQLDKRSIVTAVQVAEGETIRKNMLTYKRPGTGIAPKFVKLVIGQKAKRTLPANTTLLWSML